MKQEGTGKPRNEDLGVNAEVEMSELRFERVPEPEVRFWGNTRRNSVWGSRRDNLPEEVKRGVVYSDAGVRLRIASEIDNNDHDLHNTLHKEK